MREDQRLEPQRKSCLGVDADDAVAEQQDAESEREPQDDHQPRDAAERSALDDEAADDRVQDDAGEIPDGRYVERDPEPVDRDAGNDEERERDEHRGDTGERAEPLEACRAAQVTPLGGGIDRERRRGHWFAESRPSYRAGTSERPRAAVSRPGRGSPARRVRG